MTTEMEKKLWRLCGLQDDLTHLIEMGGTIKETEVKRAERNLLVLEINREFDRLRKRLAEKWR